MLALPTHAATLDGFTLRFFNGILLICYQAVVLLTGYTFVQLKSPKSVGYRSTKTGHRSTPG